MAHKHVPDNPLDITNNDRSLWAAAAVQEFRHQVNSDDDEETILTDLLADLLHWADRNQVDFDTVMERARGHYVAEKLDEGRPPPDPSDCRYCGDESGFHEDDGTCTECNGCPGYKPIQEESCPTPPKAAATTATASGASASTARTTKKTKRTRRTSRR